MSINMEDLSNTIIPKSDQMNADDFIAGSMTFTIAAINAGSREQPVELHMNGAKVPYKPCLTMRRALIAAWGKNGNQWVGRSLTLYCDPTVVFGRSKVGGIRISHLSNIDKPLVLLLTTTRSRRTEFTFHPLKMPLPVDPQLMAQHCEYINNSATIGDLKTAFMGAYQWAQGLGCTETMGVVKTVYDTRKSELEIIETEQQPAAKAEDDWITDYDENTE